MATLAQMKTVEGRMLALDERLQRAGDTLQVEAHGKRVYLVTGGSEPQWVNLGDKTVPRCDCGDYLHRGITCKHVMAARLFEENGIEESVRSWARAQEVH